MTVELTPLQSLPTDAIGDLFAADPYTLPDDEFRSLIKEVRRRRSEFASQEAAKRAAPKSKSTVAPTPKTAAEVAALDKPATELDLDDLTGGD